MSETTEIEGLRARISEIEAELEKKRVIVDLLFDNNPDGIAVSDAIGNVKSNQAAAAALGNESSDQSRDEWTTEIAFYLPDKITRLSPEDLALSRTLSKGESVRDEVVFCVSANRPEGAFLATSSRPLPNGGALIVTRDVTEQREMAAELERRNEELTAREDENRDLIARLRVAVDELSTPVLEIWDDVLALPVVGIVDTQRSAQMTERLLAEVVRSRSRHAIVDLTGVDVIDTSTADRFIKLAQSVQLLGARCIVTGIQPAVAQTLVELGVEFGALETHRNLKNALEACVKHDAQDQKGIAK